MSKTEKEIREDFDTFKHEIDVCSSIKQAKDIYNRYLQYCLDNEISESDNYLVDTGFVQMLVRML